MKRIKKKNGFTMVELIVVIVIILILAAVLVPMLLKYVTKAKNAAAITECSEVLSASHRTAIELGGEGTLSSDSLNNEQPAILTSAGAAGTFETDIEFEDLDTDYAILSFEYLTANNILVIYDISHDPQIYVDADGTATLNRMNSYIKKSTDYIEKLKTEKPNLSSLDRKNLIEDIIKNGGGLMAVSSSQKNGTRFQDKDLYWHPYYLGSISKDDAPIVLFANSNASDHGGWKANLVYVNGKIYECPSDSPDKNIASWGGTEKDTVTDYASAQQWLKDNGYKEVK